MLNEFSQFLNVYLKRMCVTRIQLMYFYFVYFHKHEKNYSLYETNTGNVFQATTRVCNVDKICQV